jgi:hypothetical protein
MTNTTHRYTGIPLPVLFDFDFGASARYDELDQWQREATGYTITLTYAGRKQQFDYFTGPAITDDPDLDGVMSCLVSDATAGQATFRDFCDDFGYDEDSRRAYATWQACQRTWDKLARLFGSDLSAVLDWEWDS